MPKIEDGESRALPHPSTVKQVATRRTLTTAPHTQSTGAPIMPRKPDEDFDLMLRTPHRWVYKLTEGGATYSSPPTLSDTPVARIDETDPYWDSDWISLTKYLEKESQTLALKEAAFTEKEQNPGDKAVAKRFTDLKNEVSMHRKIREIFGPGISPYQPNQLVAKRYIPKGGLCGKALLYRLACKISDLQALHQRGVLAMNPWDFMRWRINKKLQDFVSAPGQSADASVKSIIRHICDDKGVESLERYEDPQLYKAIILSARNENKIAKFKLRQPSQYLLQTNQPSTNTPKHGTAHEFPTLPTLKRGSIITPNKMKRKQSRFKRVKRAVSQGGSVLVPQKGDQESTVNL